MKQLFTILLMLPTFLVAQSIEIVSQPTTFAASGTAYAPSEGQPPYIMRFKGYNITPTAGTGALFVPIKETSAVQNDVSAATLSASGDQTNKTGASSAGNSGTQYGTASGVHSAVLGDATAASANARLLNYTDNGDGTYDVDVVINHWSNEQIIPNGTNITPTARFFSDGTKVGIPVIEDSNNAGTYVVAGATFDNSTLADTGSNLITKATAILTDLDDTDDLVLNSGFDNVNKHWYGNHGTIEVRTENDNSYFFADVASAGDAWAVNLQQKINITQGEHYILSFEASTDVGRTIIAGVGKIGGDFASVTETITLTDTPQVFEVNLNPGFAVGDEQRVFFDLGADAGIVVIDDVSLRVNENPPVDPAPTTTSSTTPTADPGNVISIFSDNYTNITMGVADWNQSTASTIQIDGRNILKLESSSFYALQDLTNGIDFSMMDKLHIDYWTSSSETASDGGVVKMFVKLVDVEAAEGGNKELLIDLGVMSNNEWNTVTVDLNSLQNVDFSLADVNQILFDNTNEGETYYIDNWYFEKTDDVALGSGSNNEPDAAPTDAPTTPPTRDAADVISIYGEAYGAAVGLNSVSWDGGSDTTEETIAGNAVLKTTFADFIGFDLASEIDASDMTHMHLDIWISDAFAAGQVFKPTFSNWGGDGSAETDKFEYNYAVGATDAESWVSLDLSFSDWTSLVGSGSDGRANLKQFLIGVASTLDIVYIDNIYLYKEATASINDLNTVFNIYPNPVQNTLHVSAGAAVDSVSIFDITGREVLRATPNAATFSLDVATLNKGLYLVSLKAGDQEMTTKLVK